MKSREEYIEYWKNTYSFQVSDTTSESFLVRIEDDSLFENHRFDLPLEAFIYFRYRNVPDMLTEGRGFFDMSVYDIREQLQESGCYLRSSGLELLDLLDSAIASGDVDPSSIIKLKELYNRTSRFTFDRSHKIRRWIHALGYVEEFIRSSSFKEIFHTEGLNGSKRFIELEQLLLNNEFSSECDLHLKMASDFVKWTSDIFLKTIDDDN